MAWRGGWRAVVLLAAAGCGMALTFSLGRWQLARAAEKETIAAAVAERRRLPVLGPGSLARPLDARAAGELLQRRAALDGQWLPEHTRYLENRPMRGAAGFFVLTPLRLADSGAVVLVQRGWAPRHIADRAALPPVQTPTGTVRVAAHVAGHLPRVYSLGDEAAGPIRQNLTLDALRAETGLPLAPVLLVQDGAPSEGLRRDWDEPGSGVDRHYGYAFQWFGLCALIALLLVWFQVVQPLIKKRR